jgi:hypothetical protein
VVDDAHAINLARFSHHQHALRAGSDGVTWQDPEGAVRSLNIAATVLEHL